MRILGSKTKVPDDYIVNEENYITPSSYVQVELVESVFKNPKRMNWFLTNSSKAKRQKEANEAPSFTDQLLYSAIHDLMISLFRNNNIKELNDAQCSELFRQIRFRFSAVPAQIARVSGKSYEDVCRLLDSLC